MICNKEESRFIVLGKKGGVMLCCVGLYGGLAVGQSLGGPWTVTAPAIGFGLGLYGDMKLMRGIHGKSSPDRNHKSKMPCCNLFSKGEKTEEPLLLDSVTDTEDVRRDSG
jgi:hypothetical protein